MLKELFISLMKSPIGYIYITSNGDELVKIDIENNEKKVDKKLITNDIEINNDMITQLNEYFDGKRKIFKFKYNIEKFTDFQKMVYEELIKVPFGITVSYGEMAKRIGKPRAYRAVGNALNKNPLPIIIPCHRVIGSNGNLGGFGYGIDMKKKLLSIENIKI